MLCERYHQCFNQFLLRSRISDKTFHDRTVDSTRWHLLTPSSRGENYNNSMSYQNHHEQPTQPPPQEDNGPDEPQLLQSKEQQIPNLPPSDSSKFTRTTSEPFNLPAKIHFSEIPAKTLQRTKQESSRHRPRKICGKGSSRRAARTNNRRGSLPSSGESADEFVSCDEEQQEENSKEEKSRGNAEALLLEEITRRLSSDGDNNGEETIEDKSR